MGVATSPMANVDIVRVVAGFTFNKQYLFFAPVSRVWVDAWSKQHGHNSKVTSYATPKSTTPSQLRCSLVECGMPKTPEACKEVARLGSLELLRCARESGCAWNEATCRSLASGGHLSVLVWARGQGCPWNESTCSAAAGGGHLNTLGWARSSGCPWDEWTCTRLENIHFLVMVYINIYIYLFCSKFVV